MKVIKEWYRCWKELGFPLIFNHKYSKEYDEWLNKMMDECYVDKVSFCEIVFIHPDGKKYSIWIENKFYAYLYHVLDITGCDKLGLIYGGSQRLFMNVRPSIRTMYRMYTKERIWGDRVDLNH